MRDLIRITAHPTDPKLALVIVPPHLAHVMGRFPHARWLPSLKGYAVHAEAEAGLHATLAYVGAHAIDERHTQPIGRRRRLMPECTACGQPAKADAQPARCPACGQPWQPRYVDPGTGHGEAVRQTCAHCGHTQRGRFGYCGACGEPIPPDDPDRPHQPPRRHLRDPLPLADTITETAGLLPTRPSADAGATDDEPPF